MELAKSEAKDGPGRVKNLKKVTCSGRNRPRLVRQDPNPIKSGQNIKKWPYKFKNRLKKL